MAATDGWRREVYPKTLARAPERKPKFSTSTGREILPLYGPEDAAHGGASVGRSNGTSCSRCDTSPSVDVAVETGGLVAATLPAAAPEFPGEFPYTRGIMPGMYRTRLWTMRQYAGMGDAVEANRRYHYLLAQGQTGLSVAFDLPTQIGFDPDHPLAAGEVGAVGVSLATLADMVQLFDGIDLARVTTSMTINATAAVMLAFYLEAAAARGIPATALGGTLQNDLLKEFIARGTQRFPVGPSLRLMLDIIAYCAREVPRFNTVSISGYHIREAGSTAAQELAFTLADGIAYVELARARGLAVDDFAPRLSFFFNVHNNLFEEAAKFRAARRLWANIMKNRFGAGPQSQRLRFHTQTAGSTLTAQSPDNNVVRVAYQALAAVLGGTQSLHTNARDEALGLPVEASAKLALRTQQLLAEETGVTDTVDPLGGSYYVEALTAQLECEAEEYFAKIEALGGMVKAVEAGYPQAEIRAAAYRAQREIESGARQVVGVNCYRDEAGAAPEVTAGDPAVEPRRRAALADHRARRDAVAVTAALTAVEHAAAGTDNLLPPLRAAAKAGATLGEICDRLRAVFGDARGNL